MAEILTDSRQIGEVAASVAQLLGRYDTVAYVLGMSQGRTVKNWAEKGAQPANPLNERRLRLIEELATTVKDETRPWVSGSWLIMANPLLEEYSPTEMIRGLNGSDQDEQTIARLQSAADYFASFPD